MENLNLIKIIIEKNIIERDEKLKRIRFFTWFGYVNLHPQDVTNELHLYYILFV